MLSNVQSYTLLTSTNTNIYQAMSAASTPPLHVLRGILRSVKSSPSNFTSPSQAAAANVNNNIQPTLQQQIISQYRESQSLPPNEAKIQRKIAYEYYILKQDLTERARLHEIDQGADEKLSPDELSRRAAARVGLQLPPKIDN